MAGLSARARQGNLADVGAALERAYPPLTAAGEVPSHSTRAACRAVERLGLRPESRESKGRGKGEIKGEVSPGVALGNMWLTPSLAATLDAMRADLAAGRPMLLLGERGGGKTLLATALLEEHGSYSANARTIALHRDMAARDLLQRRATSAEGDGGSGWADSPLVAAARAGEAVVVDGAHRLRPGVLVAALGRLCAERELDLPDGTRLVDEARYSAPEGKALHDTAAAAAATPLSAGFQLLCVAEPGSWLTPEVASCFQTHMLPRLSPSDVRDAIVALVPSADGQIATSLMRLAAAAEEGVTPGVDASLGTTTAAERAAVRFSPRVLFRLARHSAALASAGGGVDSGSQTALAPLARDAIMARFLPQRLSDAVDGWLRTSGASDVQATGTGGGGFFFGNGSGVATRCTVEGDSVVSGTVSVARRVPVRAELVPSPRMFFDSDASHAALAALLRAEAAGERAILLMGNQGVGKNVCVDQLLHMLRCEREYVQLHRDVTVASLTTRPLLEAGKLVYEDAPLVRAAVHGRVCVLDEADKAPVEVVVLLKALVGDGELLLGDGRTLLGGNALAAARRRGGGVLPPGIVPVHDGFRLWVLANRPGYPFSGNAFFRECGDAFSSISLDNPDAASEQALLSYLLSYLPCTYHVLSMQLPCTYHDPASEQALLSHVAPRYDAATRGRALASLTAAFAELRQLAESGTISHPYSMREAVATARHLEMFPDDSMPDALANAIAFEAYDAPLRELLASVFEKHGIQGTAERWEALLGR